MLDKIKSKIDRLIVATTNPIFIMMLEYAVSIIMIIGYYSVAVPLMFTAGGIWALIGLTMYIIPLLLIAIGWTLYEIAIARETKKSKE